MSSRQPPSFPVGKQVKLMVDVPVALNYVQMDLSTITNLQNLRYFRKGTYVTVAEVKTRLLPPPPGGRQSDLAFTSQIAMYKVIGQCVLEYDEYSIDIPQKLGISELYIIGTSKHPTTFLKPRERMWLSRSIQTSSGTIPEKTTVMIMAGPVSLSGRKPPSHAGPGLVRYAVCGTRQASVSANVPAAIYVVHSELQSA